MNEKTIYDNNVTKKYAVKLEKLKEGEKLSIVNDAIFTTMFQTEEKKICLFSNITAYRLFL